MVRDRRIADNRVTVSRNDRTKPVTERRKSADRRAYDRQKDRTGKYNRRTSPDRRINNILVEWIPLNHVHVHPHTRSAFGRD